jgi:threonine dehydrogenase-like Zn-dependent dehydrogenase
VSIAVSVIEKAHIKLGDSVIITGGGAIGLLVLQLAIKSGASKVLVSEPVAEKRKLAKQLGADVVIDPLHEDLLAISNKFTDGRGYSVGFETRNTDWSSSVTPLPLIHFMVSRNFLEKTWDSTIHGFSA